MDFTKDNQIFFDDFSMDVLYTNTDGEVSTIQAVLTSNPVEVGFESSYSVTGITLNVSAKFDDVGASPEGRISVDSGHYRGHYMIVSNDPPRGTGVVRIRIASV